MPRKPSKKTLPKQTNIKYTAEMKLWGRLYKSEGNTIEEVLKGLENGRMPRGVAVLTVKNGPKERCKIIPAPQVLRLFSPSPTQKLVGLKNVSNLFINL